MIIPISLGILTIVFFILIYLYNNRSGKESDKIGVPEKTSKKGIKLDEEQTISNVERVTSGFKNITSSLSSSGIVTSFIAILVATIVGVGVAIPVVQDTITNASLTGTTLTIVNLIPLMIGLVLFVAIAGLITLQR